MASNKSRTRLAERQTPPGDMTTNSMQPNLFRSARCALAHLVLPFFLALWGQPVVALTDRAHLEKWCTHESSVAAGRCIGYLLAAEDALSHDSIEGTRACLPREITLQEQHRLVLTWLKAHPQTQSSTALGLVARAYAEKYPCNP
jgi:Rap1a immunity proteins